MPVKNYKKIVGLFNMDPTLSLRGARQIPPPHAFALCYLLREPSLFKNFLDFSQSGLHGGAQPHGNHTNGLNHGRGRQRTGVLQTALSCRK